MERKQEGIAVEYAGFWVRLGACLIDVIILGIISSIIVFALYEASDWEEKDLFFLFYGVALLTVICFIISIAYYVCFWTWRGQTPGKIALGIKIIRTDGSSIGLGRSILRYICYIIFIIFSLILFPFPLLVYLWI